MPRDQRCCGALELHTGRAPAERRARRSSTGSTRAASTRRGQPAGCGSSMKEADHPAAARGARRRRGARRARPVAPARKPARAARRLPRRLPPRPTRRACAPSRARCCAAIPGARAARDRRVGDLLRLGRHLQPAAAARPRPSWASRKAANLVATGAEVIVTANPGCLMQIATYLGGRRCRSSIPSSCSIGRCVADAGERLRTGRRRRWRALQPAVAGLPGGRRRRRAKRCARNVTAFERLRLRPAHAQRVSAAPDHRDDRARHGDISMPLLVAPVAFQRHGHHPRRRGRQARSRRRGRKRSWCSQRSPPRRFGRGPGAGRTRCSALVPALPASSPGQGRDPDLAEQAAAAGFKGDRADGRLAPRLGRRERDPAQRLADTGRGGRYAELRRGGRQADRGTLGGQCSR